MALVVDNLDTLVQAYLDNTLFQEESRRAMLKREQTIPKYSRFVMNFVNENTDLEQFREDLKTLHQDIFWGAKGAGFLMEINKLATHHTSGSTQVEWQLRSFLTDVNANNLGRRIEDCYTWLIQEKGRLVVRGKASNEIGSPKSSALLISLIAFWADYPNIPYIYYHSLRQGLAKLLKTRIIPLPSDIHSTDSDKSVDIFSESDHLAVVRTLNQMKIAAPSLSRGLYDVEQFLYWATINTTVTDNTLTIKEKEITSSDSDSEIDYVSIDEPEVVQPIVSLRKRVQDLPLVAIPEETLRQRIQELQRHILVEDSVVRRIYEALLMGHVILTGPPGTGKTELARYIPEVLWHDVPVPPINSGNEATAVQTTHTAYTATLVTATSEWSGRTLIGGIAPRVDGTRIAYHTEHGHLTQAILRNWDVHPNQHYAWEKAQRAHYVTSGVLSQGESQEFRGHWLIIDEFNRAQIDAALGEALTMLSTGEALLLTIQGEAIKLPLPKDFRIIGTLNSFDRNYLNQISEALKRRFSFVEVLPPSRMMRLDEQRIVFYKALEALSHIPQLGDTINRGSDGSIVWQNTIVTQDELYVKENDFGSVFTTAWNVFEVIRIYRQLGTAQAITLIQRMIMQGILRGYQTEQQWMETLDIALSDTIADQLQVLLPDELDVLLWYLKLDVSTFIERYNSMLSLLIGKPRRLSAHLESLSSILDEQGQPFLSDDLVEELVVMEEPQLTDDILTRLFHLDQAHPSLPRFTKRLRAFKVERGL